MITRILIPQAFENMEEATIGKWLKAEGDLLQNGDPLCELITEKTTFDLPVENLPEPGILRRIIAPEKSVVPVGYIIALAGDLATELPDVALENTELLRKKAEIIPEPVTSTPVSKPRASTLGAPRGRIRATPAARRVAKERGIILEELAKTLPGKVLTEEDVLLASKK